VTWMGLGRALFVLSLSVATACASGRVRTFPDDGITWYEDDRRPFSPRPEGFYSPYIWDGANYSVFRPASHYWKFEPSREPLDVNEVDEVSNSSWFTNRLSARLMTPEEVHRGACESADDSPVLPWRVVGGKPDGANPGFQAKDGRGVRFLVKVDGTHQPERATTADVVGALLFHAAGYWVPCNRVVFIRKEDLVLEEGVEVRRTNGSVEPLTQETIDTIMSKATEVEPGLFRVSISEFIDGRPIGPFRYEGIREDDLNDRIPHEHRRSMRAMRLLAAWIDHVDTRQENTMLAWVKTSDDGRGYTRHYRIDFGEAFGIVDGPSGIPPRLGHSGYFDLRHMAEDFVTLGLLDRPWYDKPLNPAGEVLGYYRADSFDPEKWVPGYPNPAFMRATEADYAWMARIIARLTPAHIEALIDRAHLRNQAMERELVRVMRIRRVKMLERYLTRLSPLTWPTVEGRRVCLQDLAVWTGIRAAEFRRYEATAYDSTGVRRPIDVYAEGHARVCVEVPVGGSDYTLVDVVASSAPAGLEVTAPLRLHLRRGGSEPVRLVGLERPASVEEPKW